MALSSRPGRAAKLSASVAKAFGEFFLVEALTNSDDVNARTIPDGTRTPAQTITGIFRIPGKAMTPKGRGSASDDRAHDWVMSYPSVNVEDAKMLWIIRMGDKVTRLNLMPGIYTTPQLNAAIAAAKAAGQVWIVGAPFSDGHGRTTIPLTSKSR